MAVAVDPAAVAERGVERLAEDDPDVLDGVVRAGLQVALGGDREVQAPVAGEQVEHVVEEADPGLAAAGAAAVEPELERDVGLAGAALALGGAGRVVMTAAFSPTRATIDSACTVNPSARAIGAPAAASAGAASPMWTSLIRRRNARGDRPEA